MSGATRFEQVWSPLPKKRGQGELAEPFSSLKPRFTPVGVSPWDVLRYCLFGSMCCPLPFSWHKVPIDFASCLCVCTTVSSWQVVTATLLFGRHSWGIVVSLEPQGTHWFQLASPS